MVYVVNVDNQVLFSYKRWNSAIYRKMDGTGVHHVKWNKLDSDDYHVSLMCRIWSWVYVFVYVCMYTWGGGRGGRRREGRKEKERKLEETN